MRKGTDMTFKNFVKELCKQETGKAEVNVAQMSEIAKLALEILADEFEHNPYDTVKFLKKYAYIYPN